MKAGVSRHCVEGLLSCCLHVGVAAPCSWESVFLQAGI